MLTGFLIDFIIGIER